MAPKSANVGGQNPEFVLREFQGMNVLDSREAINDNEFAWCENAIPVGNANLPIVKGGFGVGGVSAEAGNNPTYTLPFKVNGIDYIFTCWGTTAWITVLAGFVSTQIFFDGLTPGQTSATPYNNQGLLIIDPSGYWDWGVTTPNVLTPQNNSAAFTTLVSATSTTGGTSLKQVVTGAGSGATFQTQYEVTVVSINNAGSGYAVGDTINLSDNDPTTPAQIVVASISGGGVITGITLSTGGSYPGPTSATAVATGPTGNVTTTTGAGSGATFVVTILAVSCTVLTRGTGYTGATTVKDETTGSVVLDTFNVTSSGVIGGTQIATYAGRVWISLNRTVYFTDVDSYNSFGGAGGSFTIADSYLNAVITVLFSANNYLYIFGDTSIDALSNVLVNGGVTSFSRINVTASIGCSTPTSVFAYYRAIVFYHSTGFYLLAGATPEPISGKITTLVNQIVPSVGGTNQQVYGAPVQVQGELCAAFMVQFNDIFALGTLFAPVQRVIFCLFFRSRWWVCSLQTLTGALNPQAMLSLTPAGTTTGESFYGGVATMYTWVGPVLYQMFNNTNATLAPCLLKTKLWDAGAPLIDKQAVNAVLAGVQNGLGTAGVTLSVDNETASSGVTGNPIGVSTAQGYNITPSQANQGGGFYLGLTALITNGYSKINLLGLRGKAERAELK